MFFLIHSSRLCFYLVLTCISMYLWWPLVNGSQAFIMHKHRLLYAINSFEYVHGNSNIYTRLSNQITIHCYILIMYCVCVYTICVLVSSKARIGCNGNVMLHKHSRRSFILGLDIAPTKERGPNPSPKVFFVIPCQHHEDAYGCVPLGTRRWNFFLPAQLCFL